MRRQDDGPPDLIAILDRRKKSVFDAAFIRRILLLVLGTTAVIYSYITFQSPPAPPPQAAPVTGPSVVSFVSMSELEPIKTATASEQKP
jgi:hypothetical protein